jgi:hypothetical protein
MVPFDPPLIYGVGGRIHFPWFSFWRRNPIAAKRQSLFVTMVDDVLFQDPDLEEAKFEILDFSAPAVDKPRSLTVIDARGVPRIPADEKAEMLTVFAEGFFLAQAELAGMKDASTDEKPRDEEGDSDQLLLFE